jgi:hypothetical protein
MMTGANVYSASIGRLYRICAGISSSLRRRYLIAE